MSCLLENNGYIDDEPSFSLAKNKDIPEQRKNVDDAYLDTDNDYSMGVHPDQSVYTKPQLVILSSLYMSGSHMAVTYSDGSVSYWDLERGQLEYEFEVNNMGLVLDGTQKSSHRGIKIHAKKVSGKSMKSKALKSDVHGENEEEKDEESDDEDSVPGDHSDIYSNRDEDAVEKDFHDIKSIGGLVSRLSKLGVLKQMAEETKLEREKETIRREADRKERELLEAQERRRQLFMEKQEKEKAERAKLKEKLQPTKPSLFLQIKPSFRPRLNTKLSFPHPPPLVGCVYNAANNDNNNNHNADDDDNSTDSDSDNDVKDSFDGNVILTMSANRARRTRMLTTADSSINRISNLGDGDNAAYHAHTVRDTEAMVSSENTRSKEEAPNDKVERNGDGRNILLADENVENLKFYANVLKENGFGVKSTTNGQGVLKALESSYYDVLVIDVFTSVTIYGVKTSVIDVIMNKMQNDLPIIATTTAEVSALLHGILMRLCHIV